MKVKKLITERFNHLLKVMSSERFLKMQGIGNEVPFFIFSFKPIESEEMKSMEQNLVAQLEMKGIRICRIDLYDLTIEMLKERGILEQILEVEPTVTKQELLELFDGVLDPKENLVPAIAAKMDAQPYDILVITGIGEVYPYIRTHNLLENMQSTAKDKPTVFFFPGSYTPSLEKGFMLNLFDMPSGNNYYRAFDIEHFEI